MRIPSTHLPFIDTVDEVQKIAPDSHIHIIIVFFVPTFAVKQNYSFHDGSQLLIRLIWQGLSLWTLIATMYVVSYYESVC